MLSQIRQKQTSRVFFEHLPQLQEINTIAHDEILPLVLEEEFIKTSDAAEKGLKATLIEWIDDLGQIFRLLKKHDYDTQETLSAIHRVLSWRVQNIPSLPPRDQSPILHFVPHPLLDPTFGHSTVSTPPILYLHLGELTKLANSSSMPFNAKISELKGLLVHTYEVARLYLRDLDRVLAERQASMDEARITPVEDRMRILQFVLMVDVQGAGILPNLGKEVAAWLAQDLAPNYPGVCSAVYIVNYSWSYNALWCLIRPFLPAKVLDRISFPSQGELLRHFPPECLPIEYGGILPLPIDWNPVTQQHSPKIELRRPATRNSTTESPSEGLSSPTIASESSNPSLPNDLASEQGRIYLHPFSKTNPYFGYPVVQYLQPEGEASGPLSVPIPLHSRRRYRDLLVTLLRLLVSKWQRRLRILTDIVRRLLKVLEASQDASITIFCGLARYKKDALSTAATIILGSIVFSQWRKKQLTSLRGKVGI